MCIQSYTLYKIKGLQPLLSKEPETFLFSLFVTHRELIYTKDDQSQNLEEKPPSHRQAMTQVLGDKISKRFLKYYE